MLAVIKENILVYNDLIDRNDIDVNSRDIYGNSIAHYATYIKNDEFRNKVFNNRKIDINVQNKDYITPLHDAITSEKMSVAISLIKNERINIKIKNKNGYTPKKLAKLNHERKIYDLLCNHPQNKIADEYVLHNACKNKNLDLFINLIQKGNDLNQKDIF